MTLALVRDFDEDAERAVLCAILLAPVASLEKCLEAKLAPAHFADDKHRVLYGAMWRVHRTGRPVDPVTLGAFLADHEGALERAGGREYMAQLLQEVPHAGSVYAHAAMVVRASRRRAGRDDGAVLDVQAGQVGDAQAFLDLDATAFLRLPWAPLDAVLGGTMPGTLSFVAGHPGGGKTSFLLTLMDRMLDAGQRIYYAGLESRPNVLRTQVACRRLGMDHGAVLAGNAQRGEHWPEQRDALKRELERQRDLDGPYAGLRFAPHPHVDTAAACGIMAEAADFGADVVVVDHIDHITAEGNRGLFQESRAVVSALDTLSKAHGLKTLASTQTNWTGRSADLFRNHRPIQEEHLYMGGHKLHVAHWCLGVYRPIQHLQGGGIPKDLHAAIKAGKRPITDALAKHTVAVNVLKSRVLGDGKHAIVTLGFWRGAVLDVVPTTVREWLGAEGAA